MESKGYVVYSHRDKRLYLGQPGAWWSDPRKAKLFQTEREAALAVKGSEIATGYERYEDVEARK